MLALNHILTVGKGGAWSCHPIEHELSAYYDLTHGQGLAIIAPAWMKYVLNSQTEKRFVGYAEKVGGIPKDKFIYPIPYEYYEKYGVRKYGFHGTSHMYVSQRLGEIENKSLEGTKIVTCHLGQGASICAIKDGKSMDTSMGLTPLAGLPMVTRSGDLDPSVVTFIMKKENLDPQTMEDILNKKSGLASISGMAPDFRVIEDESNKGTERAKIAIEQFNYSIASFIAKYAVAMKGIDYIIFTGGIGENQINIRKGICEKLEFMGVKLDLDANNMRGEEKVISTPDSKVKVYVIPTNEELMIAKETKRLVK